MKPFIISALSAFMVVGCSFGSAAPIGDKPSVCIDHNTSAVHLPNGELGAVVCCSSKVDCYQESYKVCNAYFVLQANNEKVDDFTSHDSTTEYVIQCKPPLPPKLP